MRAAVAFLTPLGRHRPPDHRTLAWFPVVGAGLGGALGLVWWGAAQLWPPLLAGALVVVADLALTGMLHLDGLVDAADGLLPPLPPERRLEVMADPVVGAFGLGVGATALLLRTTALGALAPSVPTLVALWCAARTTMAVAARTTPYARPGGLAAAFAGTGWRATALVGAALSAGAAGLAAGTAHRPGPLVGLGAGILAGAAVVAGARRRVGGHTGDVLGASGVAVETVGLVVAAARW